MSSPKTGAFLVLLAAVGGTGCEPRPGTLRERQDLSNGAIQVRVEVYDEGNRALFDRGCHVKLLAAASGSGWGQFGNAYFSECPKDFTDRVRFVNAQVAYVFMQWWYSVTVDGGSRWTTWDVAAHLTGRVYYNPRLIERVDVSTDGTGTMTLDPTGVIDKRRIVLHTDDFGRRWAEQ